MDDLDKTSKEDSELAYSMIEELKPIFEDLYIKHVRNTGCRTEEERETITSNYHRSCVLSMCYFLSNSICMSKNPEYVMEMVILILRKYLERLPEEDIDG